MRRLARLALLGFLLILAGCGTTQVLVRDRLTVVEPPAALYECPGMPPLPKGPVVKDTENAALLAALAKVGIECHASLDAIKQNVEDQKASMAAHPVKDSVTAP